MNFTTAKKTIALFKEMREEFVDIPLLLSAVDCIFAQNLELKKQIAGLKNEIRLLKNEQGKPKIRANIKDKANTNISSELERKKPRKWKKGKKKDKIKVHRTETRTVDKSELPKDAVFKGYDKVIIQNIKVIPDNICFKLESWYSKSQHKTYRAKVDLEYEGSEFSPELKAFIIDLYYQGRMSEYQICTFLHDKGILISAGTISNMLIENIDFFHQEADNIYQQGLKSLAHHQVDDTGARHKGKNGSTMIICNPNYTCFFTTDSKNRFHVLKKLLGKQALTYTFCEETTKLLKENAKLAHWTLNVIEELEGRTISTEEELASIFKPRLWNELPPGKQWEDILYYSAVATYLQQTDYQPAKILICDDAPQFKIPGVLIQLCWVHLARNFKTLNAFHKNDYDILQSFLDQFWQYYHRLDDYRSCPSNKEKQSLINEFDTLFSQKTGFDALDRMILQKAQKKKYFLLVLDYPKIPIHNNHAEQQLRSMVMKRKISSGTRSEAGLKARDTWMSLMMTCKKLGVSFLDYLQDRLRGSGNIQALDEIIQSRNQSIPFGI